MKNRKKLLVSILVIVALFVGFGMQEASADFSGQLEVHFIDVGQGNSILVKAIEEDNRHKMLIDAGQEWMGRGTVVPYLQNLDIETIHLAVATHSHADHIGGFEEIFDNFEVKNIVDSGYKHDTITYADYITAIEEHEIELWEGRAGMKKELTEGLYFEIFHPAEGITNGIHLVNIVGQIRYNDVGFLFTGDLESDGEGLLLDRGYNIENEVFQVAHHGSSTSTTEEFLASVNPEISVILVGEDNQYGHPDDAVIDRLDSQGVEIYRTDFHGNIIVSTDGQSYEVIKISEEDELDKININCADKETLMELTGIGSSLAGNIIDYRTEYGVFRKIEDITNVPYIGSSTFEDIKDEIKVVN